MMTRAPKLPINTCPAIDGIIKECKAAMQDADWSMKSDDIESLKSALEDARRVFDDVISEIEELRDANSALREYGEFYKDMYDETLSELEAKEAA